MYLLNGQSRDELEFEGKFINNIDKTHGKLKKWIKVHRVGTAASYSTT